MLIKHLPQESATKTALRNVTPAAELAEAVDAPYGPWSQTDMLLAELVDLTRWLQWAKTKAAEDNVDQPPAFPRPGVKRAAERAADLAPVINMLTRLRETRGAVSGYQESAGP